MPPSRIPLELREASQNQLNAVTTISKSFNIFSFSENKAILNELFGVQFDGSYRVYADLDLYVEATLPQTRFDATLELMGVPSTPIEATAGDDVYVDLQSIGFATAVATSELDLDTIEFSTGFIFDAAAQIQNLSATYQGQTANVGSTSFTTGGPIDFELVGFDLARNQGANFSSDVEALEATLNTIPVDTLLTGMYGVRGLPLDVNWDFLALGHDETQQTVGLGGADRADFSVTNGTNSSVLEAVLDVDDLVARLFPSSFNGSLSPFEFNWSIDVFEGVDWDNAQLFATLLDLDLRVGIEFVQRTSFVQTGSSATVLDNETVLATANLGEILTFDGEGTTGTRDYEISYGVDGNLITEYGINLFIDAPVTILDINAWRGDLEFGVDENGFDSPVIPESAIGFTGYQNNIELGRTDFIAIPGATLTDVISFGSDRQVLSVNYVSANVPPPDVITDPVDPDPVAVMPPAPPPTLSVRDVTRVEGTGQSASSLVFTVVASGERTSDISFGISLQADENSGGNDVLLPSVGRYTIGTDGPSSVQIVVPIVGDDIAERTDFVNLTLHDVIGDVDLARSDLAARGTILDDDSRRIQMNETVSPNAVELDSTTEVYSFVTDGSGTFSVDVRNTTGEVEVRLLNHLGEIADPTQYDYVLAGTDARIQGTFNNDELYFVEINSPDANTSYDLRVSNPASNAPPTGGYTVDLAVTNVMYEGAMITAGGALGGVFNPGDLISLDYTVSNLGNTQIGLTSATLLGRTGSDTGVLQTHTVGALLGGGNYSVQNVTFVVPDNAQSGIYRFGVIADFLENVDEGPREGNNGFGFTIEVDAREDNFTGPIWTTEPVRINDDGSSGIIEPVIPIEDPLSGVPIDLFLDDLSLSARDALNGIYEVEYNITNIGGGRTGRDEVSIYFSNDDQLDAGDILLSTESFSRVDNGEVDPENQYFFVPENLSAGIYHILAIADTQDGETNIVNNSASVLFEVAAQPDLLISNTYVDVSDTPFGGNPVLNYTVDNIGGASGGSTQLGFFLSDTASFDDASLIGDRLVSVPAGGTISGTISSIFGSLDPAKDQHLFVVANHDQRGSEVNYANNTSDPLRLNQSFMDPADLVVTELSVTSNQFFAEALPQFTVVVSNLGEAFAESRVGYYLINTEDPTDAHFLYSRAMYLNSGESKSDTGNFVASWLNRLDNTAEYQLTAVANFNGAVSEVNVSNNMRSSSSIVLKNTAPVLENEIAPQSVEADGVIDIAIPLDTFSDAENDNLFFEAQLQNGEALPDWLNFDGESARLTGFAPLRSHGETLQIAITASDGKLSASAGFDINFVHPSSYEITGTYRDDSLMGTEIEDVIIGEAGNDSLNGAAGNDILRGDDGADNLRGEAGNDVLSGGNDNDVLNGAAGADLLFGGSGEDLMFGGSGFDKIFGGSGTDRIFGGNDNDIANGGGDNDIINTGSGNDLVFAQNGNDLVFLQAGNDKAFGGDGNDKIFGGHGRDQINAGAGNDQVFGGADRDVITGAAGNDILSGGGDQDTFVFAANQGEDRITDFAAIDLLNIAAFGVTDGGASNQDWRDAAASVVTSGGGDNVTIAWEGGGTVVLEMVGLASLTDSNFVF